MKKLKTIVLGIFTLLLSTIAFSDILIIAHPGVSETEIPKKDVELIFLGKIKKWDDGKKIRLAALKTGDTHEKFLAEYVNKSADKFSSFWKIATVSGTGYPPKYVETEAEMVNYILKKEGSVGYISSDTPHENVKIILPQ